MVQGKWFSPGSDLSDLLPVRESVFGFGADDLDSLSWNVLVLEDGVPAATGRIWWEDGSFWIGEIGVIPELRGRRLGDLVLRLLLFKAQSHSAREIRLVCPEETEGFFSRLGFRPVRRESGSIEMMIPGESVSLDSCANCRKQNCPNRQL